MVKLVRITSLDDNRLDPYVRLTDVQLRSRIEPENAVFIAESIEVIGRALDAGMEPLSLLTAEKYLSSLEGAGIFERLLRANPQAPLFVAPEDQLEQLTGFQLTRGALAAFRRPPERPVADVVRNARLVAVLEDIRNHTNVGAIFRSAAALGADAVLVSPACYDPLYRRAVRVSMGTVFQVPWTRIGTDPHNWARDGVPLLHDLGFTTAAMALSDDSIPLDDESLKSCERLALVFGTEGDGLAESTISQCDFTVRIPMEHGVDSLNVAASSAVAFWELRRAAETSRANIA
ncbi:MAG: RNA methyltransferase [Eggerthellaceae bacterium]|nr:RNA methyltransferase [Eggerthellaceae bacterium]